MERGNHSRRKFLGNTAKAGLAFGSLSALPSFLTAAQMDDHGKIFSPEKTGFEQTPLPYSYSDLEPVIDAQTMELHYSKHAAGYAKNLQDAAKAENISTSRSVEEILANVSKYPTKVRNNGGGHYNHELFWKSMKPNGAGKPSGKLLSAIERDFGSFDKFKEKFGEAAKTRFGSGWAWLVADKQHKLSIGSTPNQDNPLMDVSDLKGFPLLGLDVWEHAYYLKYQNKRAEYVDSWWKIVNWDFVAGRFEKK